jgi:hypothetical protein
VSLLEQHEFPLEIVDLPRIQLAYKHDTSKAIPLVNREPEVAHAESLAECSRAFRAGALSGR